MRRQFNLLLILGFVLILSGCGATQTKEDDKTPVTAEGVEAGTEGEAINEALVWRLVLMTLQVLYPNG